MRTTGAPPRERAELTESILDHYSAFCAALLAGQRDAWLFVELTMPQVKALYLLVVSGRMTTSRLARGLGVSLPSATRFIDRLVERELVVRSEDPNDRRIASLVPTAAGRQVIEDLLSYRREYLGSMLVSLDAGQLHEVERGLSQLVSACRAAVARDCTSNGELAEIAPEADHLTLGGRRKVRDG